MDIIKINDYISNAKKKEKKEKIIYKHIHAHN